jgi:hypothetical protein
MDLGFKMSNTKIQDKCHELHKGKKLSTSTLPALKYTVVDGKIKVDLKWYRENITNIQLPTLKNVTKYWEKVKVNKHVAEQFIGVFDEIEKEGLVKHITSFNGAWVARFIRGSTKNISTHANGLALDLNAKENPLNKIGADIGMKGSLHELTPIFNKWGFLWGATFNRKDYMHYQLEYIL